MSLLDSLAAYLKHMPPGDDVALIVLKAHLLIEQHLNRVLEAAVPDMGLLNGLRLNFARKVQLNRVFARNVAYSLVWELLGAINTLRNDLVHELEPAKLEQRVAAVVDLAERISPRALSQDQDPLFRLRMALLMPLPFLSILQKHLTKFRAATEPLYPAVAAAVQLELRAEYSELFAVAEEGDA
jgi:hypothetical protein